MPKEVVQYPRTDCSSGTEMSVHWSKESVQGYVQIGVTRHVWGPKPKPDPDALAVSSPVHADHSNCHECAVAAEQNAALKAEREAKGGGHWMSVGENRDAPPVGEFDDPATVFTEPMSRTEINKLIRALRRARDQAYGEDA